MVVFAKFGGTAALALLEDAVEVAEVVEAAAVADLSDGAGAVDQRTSLPIKGDISWMIERSISISAPSGSRTCAGRS